MIEQQFHEVIEAERAPCWRPGRSDVLSMAAAQ
jgi:hypothetical protein